LEWGLILYAQDAIGFPIMFGPIRGFEAGFHDAFRAGSVNKLAVAHIDSDVLFGKTGFKKHQITHGQLVAGDLFAGLQ
jgi:hypothetical protein